ncbi:MAG: FAD-dependent oxidoreductase, partial [Spirochaetaceae bacterium]|nr:FAD-dependent oxidoreductase [Spirochaetaceae bacterium]
PSYLYPSLESKVLRGLFVAGQTNGTSGYEEAAAQGIAAGINAARFLAGEPALIFPRSESYIGVLIDDIVTLGVDEPYRMFTSRAERRLSLRQDTADARLTPGAVELGLASPARAERFERKRAGVAEVAELVRSRRITRPDIEADSSLSLHLGDGLDEVLRDPQAAETASRLLHGITGAYPGEWIETAELDARYAGYIAKEERLAARLERSDRLRIPEDMDYRAISGLSSEARERLSALRPLTLGQASRAPGIRSADAALLMIAIVRNKK